MNLIDKCKALAVRVITAVSHKLGTSATYNDVTRAVVLTPTLADGPAWRTKDDSAGERDIVCRVYAAADKAGKVSVVIGGHAWPTKGKREWATAGPFTADEAQQVIAATLVRLMTGKYDKGLASHVPSAMQYASGYVQRPDTVGGKRTGAVATVNVDDDAALLAPPEDVTPTVDVASTVAETPTAPVARQRR